MIDFTWNSFGASVRGPLHKNLKIPNQDSWIVRNYSWGNVVVVSDGLGSKLYSDHGSKAVCLSVLEAAKNFKKNPNTNIVDILRLIHANWLVKISPFNPQECSATCLFVIEFDGIITLGRLGDGIIITIGENEKDGFIICDNKDESFSNYTNSLEANFIPDQWETISKNSSECNGIVLCTDGVSDDLLPDKTIIFAQELYSTYAYMDSQKRRKDLNRWLHSWPVPGHTDDKTIACLFKIRGDK